MTLDAVSAPDGVLVVDKPAGLSSHDVVACVRRAFGGVKVGHTGTLDPLATGVLPLVLGKATRLARFFGSDSKSYEAVVRFGWTTDTYDALGERMGPARPVSIDPAAVEAVLDTFRGAFLQQPPVYSAKKVEGRRAYSLARRAQLPRLDPVPVTVHDLRLVNVAQSDVTLTIASSPGFYVRSLAHDLGVAVGCGAHLVALRRTRSGDFDVADAVALHEVLETPAGVLDRVRPPASLLRGLPGCRLSDEGSQWVQHGRDLEPRLLLDPLPVGATGPVRLLDRAGALLGVGIGRGRSGVLHPSIVLR
jgi:tRNA pseudouridine55 synthase